MAHGGLDGEAVERGAEDGVVVEPVDEAIVHRRLGGGDAVDDALVEVGGAHLPGLGAHEHVGGVVALGEVVEGVALLGVREGVGAAVVFDGDVTLLDVDVGGTVLAHGAELDEVALRGELLDGVAHVDGAHDVVGLGEHGAGAVHHRVRRGALLSEVNARGGLKRLKRGGEELVVADVADVELDALAGDFFPDADALVDALDRGERVESELVVEGAAAHVVDDGDLVAAVGEVEGGGPAAVAVAAEDHDLLALTRVGGVGVGAVGLVRGEHGGDAGRGRLGGDLGVGAGREGLGGDAGDGGARGEGRGGGLLRGDLGGHLGGHADGGSGDGESAHFVTIRVSL
mmetsp:Transcript_4627/g.19072  ORF Transcript_4627/g.19072 Transcript_4627/m.19072 type:complete len:343 (-) Transcript_4627:35-1063(-)